MTAQEPEVTFMRRPVAFAFALALALSVAPPAPLADDKPAAAGVRAVLELSQQFYYAGDPFRVRIVIGNDGETELANPVKAALFRGLQVRRSGGVAVEAKGKPDVPEPARPDKLAPKAFYGSIVDIAQIFPDLRTPGQYEIQWSADGISSPSVVVRIIPKYDPTKEYRARVETDQGSFTIEFFREKAPIATKAFVDMANTGFYDGLTIHEIRPDWLVAGGDPAGDGSGAPPFRYPAELSSTPVVAGTVLLRPVGVAPPANGCQFIIMLRPEPSFSGQLTVLGQVSEGLDTVQKISKLPSSQQSARPFYKPLKEIRIVKITVTEKPAATAGS